MIQTAHQTGKDMKLRIKGNSLRLRITPSEMARLLEAGRIDETIHFAAHADARLTYALEHRPDAPVLTVRHSPQEVAVVLSSAEVRRWASGTDVGIYGQTPVKSGPLEVAVEKDFACLDKSDAENGDTFTHPHQGAPC